VVVTYEEVGPEGRRAYSGNEAAVLLCIGLAKQSVGAEYTRERRTWWEGEGWWVEVIVSLVLGKHRIRVGLPLGGVG
jgi:hypothetical protein